MRRTILFLIMTVNIVAVLRASPFHIGLTGSFGTAIGTGKGNWDWTDPSEKIQRHTPAVPGLALLLLTDLSPVFQLEAGVGYYWNMCSMVNGDDLWTYRQESLEFPLGLRLFFIRGTRGLYAKGGTALILLTGESSFRNESSGKELFDSYKPENRAHAGLQFGMGYQKEFKKILWEIEGQYITFYSSPDYSRKDGSTADTRFHRMAVNFGLFF